MRGTYIKDVIGKLSWISKRKELSIDLFEFYRQLHPTSTESDGQEKRRLTLLVQFSRRTILEESFVLIRQPYSRIVSHQELTHCCSSFLSTSRQLPSMRSKK
jgi:hypothetical protein